MATNWDDETNLRKLEAMLQDGKSSREIAEAFKMVSRNAAISAVHRLQAAGKIFCGFKSKSSDNFRGVRNRRQRAQTKGPTVKSLINRKSKVSIPGSIPDAPEELEKFNATRSGFQLHELNGNQCHWPVKDDPKILFCGDKTNDEKYCAFHALWASAAYRRKVTTAISRPRRAWS